MNEQTSPLLSGQGRTTIVDAGIFTIPRLVTQEVESAHGQRGTRIPGDSLPTVGEFFGNLTPGANRQSQPAASPSMSER